VNREKFLEATQGTEWAGIDEIRETCLEAGDVFTEEDAERAETNYFNQLIRREMRRVKDSSGWPVFASVHTADEQSGRTVRVYKQEAFFDLEDYRQVVEEYGKSVKRDYRMMKGYRDRAEERYGEQLPLPIEVEDAGVRA
jgi:hypothetical protein